MTSWISPNESSPTPDPMRAASARVPSASSLSAEALPTSASRLTMPLSAMPASRPSRPSMLAAIRPTASAGEDSGVAPRMLTERSWASSADRSDRTSVAVTAAADTACAD